MGKKSHKTKKNDKFTTVALVIVFIAGLSLLLYPSFSDWWNQNMASHAISNYIENVDNIDDEEYDRIIEQAREYNQHIADKTLKWSMTEDELLEYEDTLNLGDGVMGVIEIPSIKVNLPIYHGVSEEVLNVAVGHIEQTSLPIGGKGTHAVLSGHRGLPSAKLFTNLDKLSEGDIFYIHILNETLTYEVDQILIVEPDQTEALAIDPEMDYVTLVTCTPYGINSHRLLVRGHRIENAEDADSIRITADALQIDPILMAPILAAPILLVLFILVLTGERRRNRRRFWKG